MLKETTVNMKKEELQENIGAELSKKEFYKKAEEFFKQNERSKELRRYEIEFVCAESF